MYDIKTVRNAEISILDEFDRICKANNLKYYLFYGTLLGAVRHGGFIPWDDDIDVVMPRKDYNKLLRIAPKEFDNKFFFQYPGEENKWGGLFSKIRLKNTLFVIDPTIDLRGISYVEDWKQYGVFIDIFPLDSTSRGLFLFKKIKARIVNILAAYVHYSVNRKEMSNKIATLGLILKHIKIPKLIKIIDIIQFGIGNNYISYSEVDVRREIFNKKFFEETSITFEGKKYPCPLNYREILQTLYGDDYMELPPIEKRITHSPIYVKINE